MTKILDAKNKIEIVTKLIAHFHSNLENERWNFYDLKSILDKFEIITIDNGSQFSYYRFLNQMLILIFVNDHDINLNQTLYESDEFKIQNLYDYIFEENNFEESNLNNLFTNIYSAEILKNDEKYENLNLYLTECYKCIKSSNLIPAAILIRGCLEIFLGMYSNKFHLKSKIDDVSKRFNNIDEFKVFDEIGKTSEIRNFLFEIKNLGDDVAHVNGKKINEFIREKNLDESLKILCNIIEHSILNEEISKKLENDRKQKLASSLSNLSTKNKADTM
jgi:hypothetical protein